MLKDDRTEMWKDPVASPDLLRVYSGSKSLPSSAMTGEKACGHISRDLCLNVAKEMPIDRRKMKKQRALGNGLLLSPESRERITVQLPENTSVRTITICVICCCSFSQHILIDFRRGKKKGHKSIMKHKEILPKN